VWQFPWQTQVKAFKILILTHFHIKASKVVFPIVPDKEIQPCFLYLASLQ
jgi:hypothetical protein